MDGEGVEVCALVKRGGVWRVRESLRSGSPGCLTSGASSSGPDVSFICAGTSVKIELIRASSCEVLFLEGVECFELGL